ncbi:MAG: hypothetical protein HQL03_11385 [Nitrospirae bacterium]|nr:hypothetical protein [Nitrospirota bacterium]MBF0593183.1 hypothetical protein [Nitrospirota bacterium]
MEKKQVATEEQLTYAKILDMGMKLGMLMLFVSFIIYITGIFPPFVPVDDLPRLWGLSVHEYLAKTGIHPGWAWLHLLGNGDFLNFVGVAFLGGVTLICFVAIIPVLFRKKDTVYGIIALIEVLVLALAASGVLKTGGH